MCSICNMGDEDHLGDMEFSSLGNVFNLQQASIVGLIRGQFSSLGNVFNLQRVGDMPSVRESLAA